jgi:hypothetical protein
MRERDIERLLVERVRALGGEVRKVRWIGRTAAPDRVVMRPHPRAGSRTIWVELKAPGKKPTVAQLREHRRMECTGQTVAVIDSPEQLDAWFPREA